ncbi:LysM peptidoglycan-binding domain-containing protein [Planococcus shenhongbingii]|uniref:LysM peptidoglycan-binding domain-containing protein n=1 Tax=Planococcus shenhongbingii TaxID=3058398 RepID=A0ABT8N8D8_9BACL|nr:MULTISPECIES: LysM peptidoglycan-binding domain-containing protein [unclassified Planococcus (in: firmicutes)]MDN7244131.1 LysM peptidoglycan-binding domain-containing protein [Planococcus sp. N017]WKA57308.1 LysM peptidoglycan-binding domain-containing protein [Planococcus sp. N016]
MTIIQKNSYFTALFTLILVFSIFSVITHNNEKTQMSHVQIEKGDTLWTLAEAFSGDTPHQQWIDEIMKENGLTTAKIVAGQSLKIPSDQLKYTPDETIKLAGDAE